MNVSKIVYSEKLGKNLDIRLSERKCSLGSNYIEIVVTVYHTERKPSQNPVAFESTYVAKNDENKFLNIIEKVVVDYEKQVSIDIAAVEKFNEKNSMEKFVEMLIDFNNRIVKLETGKADKLSKEDALKNITEGYKGWGVYKY